MQLNKKETDKYLVLAFLLQPFLSLILAIKNYRAPWAKNTVWFFVIFYGFTMVISDSEMDANRVRDSFIAWHTTSMSFTNFISLLYSENTYYVDIAQPLIMFLVSRITDNYYILFAVYGLIFGYFYSRNIWYLIDRSGLNILQKNVLLIITFAFVIGFWNINGFRMWTAAQVFFYGAIRHLMEGRKKGLLIAASSVLIHFSFMLPVAAIFIFSLIKNRTSLLYWFFIISFFISEIDLLFLRDTMSKYLPSLFKYKIGYANVEYAESIEGLRMQMNWYARLYGSLLNWSIALLLSVIYFKGLYFIKQNKSFRSLLGFSFFFLGIVNLVSNVPSMDRFYRVGALFSLALVFLYMQQAPQIKLLQRLKYLIRPALILYCIVSLRIAFDTISFITVFGNPILAMFTRADLALIQLIK